jgi:thiamine-monophosphate kinase
MVSLQTVGQLGEIESLRRTVSRLSTSEHAIVGSGDDAAVVATTDDRFVVTTDTMIEGHDFRLDWSSFYDLGFKAVATNLSDVAAMGATPTALVVAISVPPTTLIENLEAFADGLRDACQQLAPGCGVVGGDLASSEQVFISVTAHGALQGREPVLRSGAKPGDVIAIAGTLGRAAAGLALLASGKTDAINAYDDWVSVQKQPRPPIAAGVEAALAGASSMLDVSDGLAKDAARISRASGVAIRLNKRDLDGFIATVEEPAMALGADASTWVLFGGEDHGLLATFAADAKLPRAFKPIGVVASGEGVWLDDQALPENGWDSITGA